MLTDVQLTNNREAAEDYYDQIQRAVDRNDFEFIAANPPDEIDFTQLPQTLLDKFEELYGQAGEMKENQGKLCADGMF